MYNVSLADGLEFIRSMLTGGSGYTLADAVQAAKSADIDPYGRKARYGTLGDGWVGPTENWREKVRKWEQDELSQLEEEQRKRRAAAFHEWEERMGEAELMESGRADRIKQLQQEWAEAEVKFREEAMEAEKARQARLTAKTGGVEEINVGEEARKRKEQEERKKNEEREAALQREAEERERIDEEEKRKKREEEERIAREKREEEERIKREEEERLRKEREEAERLRREEEERLRKEEEERLRLEEEERKREEEETAKKFGLSGFGAFGADPFG